VGPACQRPHEKEKEEIEGGPLREKETGSWAGWAGKGGEVSLFFFYNSFQIQTFSTQTLSKLFKFFHKIL
jgi:hypothetical protein